MKKKYGEWVLITGATDGIGLEYARQFGKRGHSLMVLGRNPEKLERVKNELLTENPSIEVVTILADLNKTDPSASACFSNYNYLTGFFYFVFYILNLLSADV